MSHQDKKEEAEEAVQEGLRLCLVSGAHENNLIHQACLTLVELNDSSLLPAAESTVVSDPMLSETDRLDSTCRF